MQIQNNVSFGSTAVIEGAPKGTKKLITGILKQGPEDRINVANFNMRPGSIRIASSINTPEKGIIPVDEIYIPKGDNESIIKSIATVIRRFLSV